MSSTTIPTATDPIQATPVSIVDETTPLLADSSVRDEENEIDASKQDNADPTTMFLQECGIIAWNAVPIFSAQILEYSLVFVSVFTLGHLSTTALAAISVATMTANVTGLSMIQGFCSALDTLLPSAWTSDQPQLVTLWAMRMAVLVCVELVLILTLWLNAEPILLALKQEPEIASLAGQYLRYIAISLPAWGCSTILRRWYQAQGLFTVPTKIIVFVSPINLVLNYTLVHGLGGFGGFGFIGAPMSTVISQYLVTSCSLTYAYFRIYRPIQQAKAEGKAVRSPFHPPSRLVFHHLPVIASLGISGIFQLASEWWAWELVALFASFLGSTSMAAQSILLTTEAMLFQLVVGVSYSSNVRIGGLLGESKSKRVQSAMWSALALGVLASGITCIILLVFRKYWPTLFANDRAVTTLVSSILPTIALFQILDGNTAVTAAIMRAKGQQSIGAMLIVTGYYVIGLPSGVWLTFRAPNKETGEPGWGLIGLWYGLTISLVFTSIVGTVVVLRTNWDDEVKKVMKRLKSEEEDRKRTLAESARD